MYSMHHTNQYRNKQKKIHIAPKKVAINLPKEYFKKQRAYETEVSTIKEYAYYDEVNIIYRDDMEDGFFRFSDYLDDDYKSFFFGIFDGHNGKDVMMYIVDKFPGEYQAQLKQNEGDIQKAFYDTFEKLNEDLEAHLDPQDQGSTAFVGIIRQEEDRKFLYYANIGDTLGYLYQNNSDNIIQLGENHRLNNEDELKRIKEAGGDTLYNRVGGVLEMTRCFGDLSLKNQGIISKPFVNQIQITQEHSYIVAGSDGLLDFVSKEDIQQFIKTGTNCEDIADKCLSRCIQNKSNDNISIMVMKLQ